jgi:hypothetical protein
VKTADMEITMKKILVMAAMIAAVCTACSESKDCAKLNGTERCDLSTDHGSMVCDSNIRYMNQNGNYVAYPCDPGYACISGGVCTRMPECVDSAVPMSCSGNTLVYCSGGMMRYEACGDHTVCNVDTATGKGACVVKTGGDSCVAGSERCDINGMHQVCSDTGVGVLAWVNSPCGAGMTCSAGACVLADPCVPSDKRCYYDKANDSNIVQTCTSNRVWETSAVCSGTTSACSNGTCVEPGSESNPSDDYYVCTSDICTEEGDTCGELCVGEGYDNMAWCDDEYVYCEDPSNGNAGGGSDYVNCSNEECTLSDGSTMLCGEACVGMAGAGNEAWCTADGSVACAPTNPGGSGGGNSGSGDYYDCSDEVCTKEGDSCLEACQDAGYSTDKAWCDDEYVYCADPSGSGGGNSGGGGSSNGPSVDKNSCNLSSSAIKAAEPFGTCSTSNADCEVHVCWYDAQYSMNFTEYLVCMDLSEYDPSYGYMWYPVDGIYMQCNNKCDSSSQACDSQGGEYGQYQ